MDGPYPSADRSAEPPPSDLSQPGPQTSTLASLPVAQRARLTSVSVEASPAMIRLMEMGLVPGALVEVRKRAPFRGPLELRVEGYLLTIRRAEAEQLGVEPLPDPERARQASGAEFEAPQTTQVNADEAA